MASLTLSEIAVSSFTKILVTFEHILTRAEDYAKEKGIDVDESFVQARLIEDQLPFSFQVQNATKNVVVALGRLSGVEAAPLENTEKTFADLHQRIQKTLEIVRSFDASNAVGRDEVVLELPVGGKPRQLTVRAAVLDLGLPNVFFHVTTGYSILRSKGVPLGKLDFLTSFLS